MAKIKDVKQHMDPITMELGGKTRTIQFDMNAFGELEKRYGSIDAAMEKMIEGKMNEVKVILWASLIHDEVAEFDEETGEPIRYNITPYQVGSWIKNPKMLQEVSTKIGAAMSDGMPDPADLPDEVKKQLKAKGFDIEDGQVKNVKKV